MFELLRHRLRHNRRARALWIPSIAIVVASIVAGLGVWVLMFRVGSATEIADRLAERGEYEAAEVMYWRAIRSGRTDFETVIAFIDNYAELRTSAAIAAMMGGELHRPVVGTSQMRELLAGLDPPADTLARFWYQARVSPDAADASAVETMASASPPVRWANHLLGRRTMLGDDYTSAAVFFAREGMAHPEAAGDLELALALWASEDEWEEVQKRLADPRFSRSAGLSIRLGLAIHERDWPAILALVWPAGFEDVRIWPVVMAIIAAALWLSIATRMGRAGESVAGRKRLYALAFVLGILSIYPTLVVITIEDVYLGLRETGDPIADAIFFTFGVGLREEACKILLFLPLLPLLRRRGSRLEALACGALVGLGFAAEENIGYFHQMSLSVAIQRFLTANFLHMALSGLIAVAIYDGARAREPLDRFDVVFPLAVLFHGAYDFFLSSGAFGDLSILSMVLFILLAQRFLRQVVPLLPTDDRERVLGVFVFALVCLSGVSYVYAAAWVGPVVAFVAVAEGFIGVVILVFMFVRELA